MPRNFEVFLKKMNIHFPLNLGILTEKEIIQKLASELNTKKRSYTSLETEFKNLDDKITKKYQKIRTEY